MGNQAVDNDNKRYYLAVWKNLLHAFLGWSEPQVLQWVRRWEEQVREPDFLDSPDDMVYHQTPQYWVTHLLVPDSLKAGLSHPDLLDLQGRILDALSDGPRSHFPVDTDWRPYREKVEHLLAGYGAQLPAPVTR